MLSQSELRDMRETAESALPDQCRIITRTPGKTAGGGTTYTNVEGEWLRCRISYIGGTERMVAEQLKIDASHRITMERGVELHEQQEIEAKGHVYSVTHVLERGDWQILPVALVRQVR